MHDEDNFRLNSILIKWYNSFKRDLPWRNTSDPYIIWLSEVILQQTRVNQGYDYFMRFVERFPDVRLLASAPEDEVLKFWQGLGYYSRARNLHAAARTIVEKYDGVFPSDYKDVLSLKGVGEYTAAAIVSFAYNKPYPVIDGNVYRVLSRIFAIDDPIDSGKGKVVFKKLAEELIDKKEPGLYNQAIMEFGALQCVPVSPDCHACPASDFCMAYALQRVSAYPVKQGKQKVRHRYFNYFDIRYGEYTYLQKRQKQDIWKNLYEYPLIETPEELDAVELQKEPEFEKLFSDAGRIFIKPVTETKHVLSHQIIHASFYRIDIEKGINNGLLKVVMNDVEKYPVSRLIHKYMEKYL
jgi:A/G-specific adenine glycosylase